MIGPCPTPTHGFYPPVFEKIFLANVSAEKNGAGAGIAPAPLVGPRGGGGRYSETEPGPPATFQPSSVSATVRTWVCVEVVPASGSRTET